LWSRVVGDTERVITWVVGASSAPAAYRFPREVTAVAVRCYLRYSLSYWKACSPGAASSWIT